MTSAGVHQNVANDFPTILFREFSNGISYLLKASSIRTQTIKSEKDLEKPQPKYWTVLRGTTKKIRYLGMLDKLRYWR